MNCLPTQCFDNIVQLYIYVGSSVSNAISDITANVLDDNVEVMTLKLNKVTLTSVYKPPRASWRWRETMESLGPPRQNNFIDPDLIAQNISNSVPLEKNLATRVKTDIRKPFGDLKIGQVISLLMSSRLLLKS